MEKRIGKIQKISFGHGGYQDACLGVAVTLGSDGWGVGDFKGTWSRKPDDRCQWTETDQTNIWGEMCRWIGGLLKDAKVDSLEKLAGKPVEVTLDGNCLKSWRILTEAI